VTNKDQEAWDEYRESLERPEEMFVGWQNAAGTKFTMICAKSPTLPPSVQPLEAVWFFRASSWKEANRAWSIHNGWTRAA
jgi:hypothetical protein